MLQPFEGKAPRIESPSFIAESADIIGDVQVRKRCSIWHGAVVRGDLHGIVIGEGTSIQDNAVLHVRAADGVRLGDEVTVGHGALLHGCSIGDRTLVGVGAIVLDGAEVAEECLIGAGALVPPGSKIPPRSMVLGVPGKVVRQLNGDEVLGLRDHAARYWSMALKYINASKQ